MNRLITLCLLIPVLLAGCADQSRPLHIGAKNFTEQFILAELMAQLAENEGIPVRRSIPYGDTFLNQEGLKRGDIDLYAEYNGTGLVLLGQPPTQDGDLAQARVEELFEPLGLRWLDRFGFSNEYVLVMRSDQAAALDIRSISDLARLAEPPRFVIDEAFLERPLDGYAALLRRYGLRAVEPLVFPEGDKRSIYEALLDGEVDVAEAFSTDGQIADFGLTVLEDDLDFFPVYEAAPLVRGDALERFPALEIALNRLSGRIDVETMRRMNQAVELEGRDYQLVAQEFLVDQQLTPPREGLVRAEELLLAVGMLDELGLNAGRAVRATRKAFPTRHVDILRSPDPITKITDAEVRLAMVGAESFFTLDGVFPQPIEHVEALGVVGYRLGHLLTTADSEITGIRDIRRLGVGPDAGSSQRTATMAASSLGLDRQMELIPGTLAGQIEQLRNGELDGLFLMVTQSHVELTRLLQQGGLRLLSLPEWAEGNNLVRFPFLRPARIPAGTYPGQDEALETLSTQVVLAGPAPRSDEVGDRGPAIIVGARTQPISNNAIRSLNEALETNEQIDPMLPRAAVLSPARPVPPSGIETDPAVSLTNLIIILVVIYLIMLFRQEQHRGRRRRSTPPQPVERTEGQSS